MDLNSGLEDPPSFDNTMKPTKAILGTHKGLQENDATYLVKRVKICENSLK